MMLADWKGLTMPGKPPDPGKLRSRLTFQRPPAPEEAQRPSGEVPEDWRTMGTKWAFKSPTTGREIFQADQLTVQADGEIWCRWFPGPDATWRGMMGGEVLNFSAVINWENRNLWWYILYTEPE